MNIESEFETFRLLMIEGKFKESKKLLNKIYLYINRHKNHENYSQNFIRCLEWFWEVSMKLKKYDESIKLFSYLNDFFNHKNIQVLLNLSVAYSLKWDIQKSKMYADIGLDIDSNNVSLLHHSNKLQFRNHIDEDSSIQARLVFKNEKYFDELIHVVWRKIIN